MRSINDLISYSIIIQEDDGGQPIKHYQIRMMDFDTGEWHIAGDVRIQLLKDVHIYKMDFKRVR